MSHLSEAVGGEQLSSPLAELDGIVTLSENEKAALSQLGTRLVGLRRFHDARSAFELLLAADPDNAFYHRALGICCENLDLLDDARAALDRAIEMDPNDAFALLGRATVRMREGDHAGAIQDLRAAQQAVPDPQSAVARRIAVMLKAAQRAAKANP